MFRHTRTSRFFNPYLFAAMSALALGTPPRHAFAFEGNDDTTPGGAGGDTTPGGAGGGGDPPARRVKTYDQNEFNAVTRARDKAKKSLHALIRTLGKEPDEVTIVETDDPENPFTIEGLEDVVDALQKNGGDSEAKKRASAEAKNRLTRPLQRKIEAGVKREKALIAFIEKNMIVAPIRAACAAENIVDDDDGKYSDVVSLLKSRFKTNVYIDEDDRDASATVEVTALAEDSDQPIDNATGDPWEDARKLVRELASKKPKFRKSEFRGGPGAGGARVGDRQQPRQAARTSDEERRQNIGRAAAAHYGVAPGELGLPTNGNG
jgi:hypothetical protein